MKIHRTYVDLEGRKFSILKVRELLQAKAPKIYARLQKREAVGNDFWEALLNYKLPQVQNTCKLCGGLTSFRKNGDYWGYSVYCTIQCAKEDPDHMTKVVRSYRNNPENRFVGQKIKSTWLAKYGVTNVIHLPKIREKIENTLLRRYGVKATFSAKAVREKSRRTMLKRYGSEFYSQSAGFPGKIRATSLRRYGTTNPSKSKKIKKRIVESNLRSMGVEYAMQNPESFIKQQNSAMSTKWTTIKGKRFSYRGYENYALNYLVKFLNVPPSDIATGEGLPSIQYKHKGKTKVYYPDIELPDKLIEVKSTYTLGLAEGSDWFARNKAKFKAALNAGHSIELWLVLPAKKRILRFTRPENITRSSVAKMIDLAQA